VACQNGHVEAVKALLEDKRIDPDKKNHHGATPFFIACFKGQSEVVRLLLSHPRVDPSRPNHHGATPFFIACQRGHVAVLRMLLEDRRVDPERGNKDGTSPLWIACQQGHDHVIRLLLGSGRIRSPAAVSRWNNTSPAQRAHQVGYEEIAELIDAYAAEPLEVSMALRRAWGWHGSFPFPFPFPSFSFLFHVFYMLTCLHIKNCLILVDLEDTFALICLFSDGYITLKERSSKEEREGDNARRFFQIVSRLPFDIKMVLTQRAFRSKKDYFLSNQSDAALKRVLSLEF